MEPQQNPALAPIGAWRFVAFGIAMIWAVVVVALPGQAGRRATLAGQAESGGLAKRRDVETAPRRMPAELGLARPARLAVHRAITSPVVIGGRMPIILVPPDWAGWPEAHRRDSLLHELTHLKRHDDWAKLLQELVLVPFFFHPFSSLAAQPPRPRTRVACDEAVVALGGDPVVYARLLLDLARRPGRRLIPSATLLEARLAPILRPRHGRGPHRATPGG